MFLVQQQRPSAIITPRSSISEYTDTERRTGPYLEGNLKLLDTLECSHDVMCCKFSPDGSLLAAGLADGTIRIFDSHTFSALYSLSDLDTLQSHLPVTQLCFRVSAIGDRIEHANILIAAYASGHVKFWHFTSGTCLHTVNEIRQTLALALNPDGTKFGTAGADPQIHIYDEATKKLLNTCEPSDSRDIMDGHRLRVFAIKYHPSFNNIFITGGWDDTVQYWDDRQRKSVRKLSGPHICGDALDIDPLHNHIVTGSWRKHAVLQIWDFSTGEKIKDVPQDPMNTSLLYCTQWLGRDSIVCGGTGHNMARVIDRGTLNTTGQLVDLPQSVYCIDNDRQGLHPKVAIGCSQYVFIVQSEKKS